jgi:hypothetical protein
MDIEKGIEAPFGGVIGGSVGTAYFHKVKLCVFSDMIEIKAAFSRTLSVAGLLGRNGFFENFIITFDAETRPPGFEFTRIHRA